MRELETNTVEHSELVEQTFKFWFGNINEHIRSPFPEYIRSKLKTKAVTLFHEWASSLHPKAKDEVNSEVIGEKFEEIIFETATNLVQTEDEKMTISYPFLPRINDEINKEEGKEKSKVTNRTIVKDGDYIFMKLIMENEESKEKWETKIELPK